MQQFHEIFLKTFSFLCCDFTKFFKFFTVCKSCRKLTTLKGKKLCLTVVVFQSTCLWFLFHLHSSASRDIFIILCTRGLQPFIKEVVIYQAPAKICVNLTTRVDPLKKIVPKVYFHLLKYTIRCTFMHGCNSMRLREERAPTGNCILKP